MYTEDEYQLVGCISTLAAFTMGITVSSICLYAVHGIGIAGKSYKKKPVECDWNDYYVE